MAVTVRRLSDSEFQAAIPQLSRLRCEVFRAWPYLYVGGEAYERDYLKEFAQGQDAVLVAAFDGDAMVGAATAAPLASHTSEFLPLFREHGFDPRTVFYLGESVLLPAYRGRGLGHAFFDAREAAAREMRTPHGRDYEWTAFCGVVRDENDPRRPTSYRPLDAFWEKRGYAKVDGMIGSYDWQEIGEAGETSKPMQFWARRLT